MNTKLSEISVVSQRSCGPCTVCCHVSEVKDPAVNFSKEAWSTCSHACSTPGGSCNIFDKPERPAVCKSFYCSWARGYGEDGDRPDKSGIMVSVNEFNGGRWITAVESQPNALITTGRDMVIDVARKIDLPVIVSKYESRPPHDKGDCTVIKKSLLARTVQMRGALIQFLDDEQQFGMYELIKS